MARSTRQERQRRRAQAAGTPPLRPPVRPRPTAEEEPREQPAEVRRERTDQVRPGIPGVRFVGEAWAELQKVEWPNRDQVVQGTAVVLIACLVVGVYLYALDQGFKRLVQNVFLG